MSGALTIGEILRRSTAYLTEKGSSSPRLDADLLLAHALGVERLQLYTDSERPLTPSELERARELVGRRARREPVAYLLGERAFRRLRLGVGPEVLVPRPETEVLVEWALAVAPEGGTVLDWGTGSGAVALALADEGAGLRVTAVDRSPEALGRARSNGLRCECAEVEWLLSDGFAELAGRRFDVIAANPPYLSPGDLAGAPPELGFEPEGALVLGADRTRGDRADRAGRARPPGAGRLGADRGRRHAGRRRPRRCCATPGSGRSVTATTWPASPAWWAGGGR